MAYLAPIHKPSSIRHALKLNFLSPEDDTLVVAKANRLEFYSQQEHGLLLKHSKSIYGKVTMLQALRPASSKTDHLFVGTDSYFHFTLSWDPTTKQLRTEKSAGEGLDEKAARDSQTGERCNIDPERRLMTLELHEGIINVIPIASPGRRKNDAEIGTLGVPVPTRIPELHIRASCFLHRRKPSDNPQIALLYEDSVGKIRLKLREIQYTPSLKWEDQGTTDMESEIDIKGEVELGASHIIPLAAPAYGCLVLGETSISYCDEFDHTLRTEPLHEATVFVAWAQIDQQRFVLADDYGKLYLLMIIMNHKQDVESWHLDVLGETSRASTLVYLDAGRIFVGSHQGNSQVVQITQGHMDIIQTFPNIAPILDFTIMDMGNRSFESQVNEYSSGQARIVVGSGAFKDGSLRSVRSGVGLEDLGSIGEMKHVTDLFSLKSDPSLEFVDTLVVSFITHTRVFKFASDGEVEEMDSFKSLDLSRSTLLATNTSSGHILHVTSSSAAIVDGESGMLLASWSPEGDSSIAAVSVAGTQVLVSIGSVGLAVLSIAGNGLEVQASRTFDAASQVACIAMSPLLENTCAVGFWHGSSVALLDCRTLETIHTETVEEDSIAVPRSLLVAQILEGALPTLFVGMADGNVVTYSVDPTSSALTGKKSTILGTQQASFKALPRGNGLHNVLAICEHPSLIYGSEGRIVYSAITAEDASCVCTLDTDAYPNAIAIATENELKLAVVDEERTTHVQTLHVGETVRRIAYSPELRAFGLGTIKRTLEDSYEKIESHFKLVDEIAFQELHTFALKEEELVECCIRAKLDDGSGELAERFIVGTAYMDEESSDAARGRILVLEVTEERRLKLVSQISLKGACRCLAMCEGKIVAALIKTVVVYDFKYEQPSTPHLVKLATYRTATAPIDISVTDTTIAIADLMKSVSLVQLYDPSVSGMPFALREIARHYDTAWGTAVANVAPNTYLEADAEGNLVVLAHDPEAFSEDEKRRLRVIGELHLGEMVNRIRRVDVQASASAIVVPRAFLGTVEGSIYLFGLIAPEEQDLLMRLQERMAGLVESPGGLAFEGYRAFKTVVREGEDGPMRFVDGEVIEGFLDVGRDVQEKVVEGLGVGVEEVWAMVEGLKRLH